MYRLLLNWEPIATPLDKRLGEWARAKFSLDSDRTRFEDDQGTAKSLGMFPDSAGIEGFLHFALYHRNGPKAGMGCFGDITDTT